MAGGFLNIFNFLKKLLLFNLTVPDPEAPDPSSAPFAEGTKKPFWFFISTVIPMVILSLLFFNGYYFIHQEMDDSNIWAFWSLQIIFFIDIAVFTAFPLILMKKKRHAGILSYIMMVILQVAMVVVAFNFISGVRPAEVNRFIFPEDKYLCYLFTFFMPSVMHAILGTSVSISLKRLLLGLGISIAAVIFIPVSVYFCFFLFLSITKLEFLNDPSISQMIEIGVTAAVVFCAVCFMVSVMYLLILLYRYFETRAAKVTLVLFAAIILPYAGLLLNILIPFPTDFQDWRVYAMTAVNAFFLLFPMQRNRFLSGVVFFGRGACYIFTLYFFLVFLPYLPLFLPAVIAAGAGFLILAPTVLFHVHTRMLIEDFKRLSPLLGGWRVWLLFIVSLAVIPSCIVFKAFSDRALVDRGLKLIYAADYEGSRRMTPSEIKSLAKVVSGIYDYKNGIEAPYLTSFYQWIAFDNMVLSDSKLKDMYFKLTRKKLKPSDSALLFSDPVFSRSRRSSRRVPSRNSSACLLSGSPLTSYELLPDGSCRCVIAFKTSPAGGQDAVVNIDMPEYVFVSGLSLKIGQDFVKGRIFEKKSAQWIYDKIVNENRDPALLYYGSDNSLRLHVFPANESRDLKLELLFPANLRPLITLENKKIVLNPFEKGIPLKVEYSGFGVYDPASAPEIKRKPVLCFIVDATAASYKSISQLDNIIADISKKTGIRDFKLEYASMYSETAVNSGRIENGLPEIPDAKPMPGGFMAERVLKTEILKWRDAMDSFPVFVVVAEKNLFKPESCDFKGFSDLLPETGYILFANQKGDDIDILDFAEGYCSAFTDLHFHPVCRHPGLGVVRKYFVYSFLDEKSQSGVYGEALRLKAKNLEIRIKPSLTEKLYPSIVKESKRLGVVVPATSYIVLERDSQWKALEAAEKKKLMADKNFDLEETPEPGFLILGGLLLVSFMLHRKFRKNKNMLRINE